MQTQEGLIAPVFVLTQNMAAEHLYKGIGPLRGFLEMRSYSVRLDFSLETWIAALTWGSVIVDYSLSIVFTAALLCRTSPAEALSLCRFA